MPGIAEKIGTKLLLWAVGSMGAGLFGLFLVTAHQFWRSFFFMNGVWGMVDGAIGLLALRGRGPEGNIRRILLFNAWLDIGYLIAGAVLFLQRTDVNRGFGLAILIQGGFLLFFDLWHALTGIKQI